MNTFQGEPTLTPQDDGIHWLVRDQWSTTDDVLGKITVPALFVSDLGSIPQWATNIFPKAGINLRAYLVHDWLYASQKTSRDDADTCLMRMMIALGCPTWRRWVIYIAVSMFGGNSWASDSLNVSKWALLLFMLLASPLKAQTQPGSFSEFMLWVSSQQANTGFGFDLHGGKYIESSWDLVSYGQKGLNVGKAGALDLVDVGLGTAVPVQVLPGSQIADRYTRYGLAVPVHAGNLWNSIKLPAGVNDHVWFAPIPNSIITPWFLWPEHRPISKWNWKQDFLLTFNYRYGGS